MARRSSRSYRSRHGSRFIRNFLVLVLAFGCFVLLYLLGSSGELPSLDSRSLTFLSKVFDFSDPTIEPLSHMRGIGADPVDVKLKIRDASAGVSSVVASVIQGEKESLLLNKTFDEKSPEVEVSVPVDGRRVGLAEGDAVLRVVVHDGSLWSNSAKFDEKLPVSFVRPRVEVLTSQQNSTVGGTEVVVFRFVGRVMEEGGIEAGPARYPAMRIADFDSSYSGKDGVFVAMFPLPYDFNPDVTPLKVYGRDDFGNVSTTSFNYRIAKKTFSTVDMKLTDQFVNTKVPELLDVYRRDNPGADVSGDHFKDFRIVNEDLRKMNEQTVQESLRRNPVRERLWRGAFIRPLAAAPKASFAERRLYKKQSDLISQSFHMGIDLADVSQARVTAANRGRVVFTGQLGIYGQTVILDHGGGLSSLYGHLSSVSLQDGEEVQQGQEIARTGATGLAGGDHLHFEIRVHGVPVSPIEWWDPLWIREHVEDKVRTAAGGV